MRKLQYHQIHNVDTNIFLFYCRWCLWKTCTSGLFSLLLRYFIADRIVAKVVWMRAIWSPKYCLDSKYEDVRGCVRACFEIKWPNYNQRRSIYTQFSYIYLSKWIHIVYPRYYLRCDLVIWICPFINYWMWASALMLMCISNCGNELFFDKNQQAPKSDSILVLFNIDSANQIIRQRTGECVSGCK